MYGLLIRSQNRWIVDTKKPIKAVEKLVVLKKKKKKEAQRCEKWKENMQIFSPELLTNA